MACYPGGVGAGPTPQQPVDPLDLTKDMSCPLLGIFGKDDLYLVPDAGDPEGAMIEVSEKSIMWLKAMPRW